MPDHLTSKLAAPQQSLVGNEGFLNLLAQYEALRRRANADRAAVIEIMGSGDMGVSDE